MVVRAAVAAALHLTYNPWPRGSYHNPKTTHTTKKAYRLKRVLTIYNLANVLISAFISYEIIKYKVNQNVRQASCPS